MDTQCLWMGGQTDIQFHTIIHDLTKGVQNTQNKNKIIIPCKNSYFKDNNFKGKQNKTYLDEPSFQPKMYLFQRKKTTKKPVK